MKPIAMRWTHAAQWRIAFAALATAQLLTSCGDAGRATDCAWAKQIYISKADQLTNGTAQQILAHNEAGAAICGWH